jgi:hypothetical protein
MLRRVRTAANGGIPDAWSVRPMRIPDPKLPNRWWFCTPKLSMLWIASLAVHLQIGI